MKDCTILLQGRINEEAFNLWIQNYKDYNVVVSIWEDEDLTKYEIPSNWIVVVNQYPLVRFWRHANLDYQIITTLKGLNKVETNWVIKMRCDEYWSNIEKIYNKMIENPDKIISGSMYFRKWGMYKFHPSDKILGGTLDNIFLMFESTLHNLEANVWDTTTPESQLGFGFILAKEPSIGSDNKIICDYATEKKLSEPIDDGRAIKLISKAISIIFNESTDIMFSELSKANELEVDWGFVLSNLNRYRTILDGCIDEIELKTKKVDVIEDKTYMQKWFDIIDINELKPYIATCNLGNGNRHWYRDDFDNDAENCLETIS